ncbi:hypothetical protein TYRP_002652 [Tyrophagus putrescentiae]|nr:hypothetical protein TYRP_002652 [Tyrophagus putrescentiae]
MGSGGWLTIFWKTPTRGTVHRLDLLEEDARVEHVANVGEKERIERQRRENDAHLRALLGGEEAERNLQLIVGQVRIQTEDGELVLGSGGQLADEQLAQSADAAVRGQEDEDGAQGGARRRGALDLADHAAEQVQHQLVVHLIGLPLRRKRRRAVRHHRHLHLHRWPLRDGGKSAGVVLLQVQVKGLAGGVAVGVEQLKDVLPAAVDGPLHRLQAAATATASCWIVVPGGEAGVGANGQHPGHLLQAAVKDCENERRDAAHRPALVVDQHGKGADEVQHELDVNLAGVDGAHQAFHLLIWF